MESLPEKHVTRIKAIGAKLKELRKEAGYTSSESFAFDNDIPRVQYGKMERAVNFKISTLMRVLDAHKITMEEFFKGLK
ncbi:MAG: helix-turn-helix domain-containing protein [Flavobacteriales bacterium]